MSRYCLDTSAYSQFRRGNRRVVELLDRAESVGVPAVVLGELRAGFRAGGKRDQNETDLREFLGNPIVEVLPIDEEVSLHYAEIVHDLRRVGTPVPTNDIWIAATAARSAFQVVTFDNHFLLIERVGSVVLPL